MQLRLRTKHGTAILATVLFVTICLAGYLFALLTHYRHQVQTNLTMTHAKLQTLIHQLDSNTPDAAAMLTIQGCSTTDQARYDTDLASLATLTGTELQTMQYLFAACAHRDPSRKLVMVTELQQVARSYERYVEQLRSLSLPLPSATDQVAIWKRLVTLETDQAGLLNQLTSIQGQIISARLHGSASNGNTIRTLLADAVTAKQKLTSTKYQIRTLETQLSSL